MIDATIEEIIRSNLVFVGTSAQGWNVIYCEVCGDGTKTKGPRGGWLFQDKMAFYHCFNCGVRASFDPDRENPYSKEMRNVFKAFNIPEDQHKALAYKKLLTGESPTKPQKKENKIPILEIPKYFYTLESASPNNIMAQNAKQYLLERKIDPNSYPFYLSTGIDTSGDPREEAIAKSLMGRLIIPAFKGKDLVYWQARSLTTDGKGKYINPSVPKTSVIYGFDKLYNNIDKPLYITEGFFDSHHLDGVCVLGNEFSHSQIEIISRSPRRKIVVPDKKINKKKHDNGNKLASQAIDLGWEIALPDIGNNTDVTEAIQSYGKLYVLNSISEKIYSGFAAKIALDMW